MSCSLLLRGAFTGVKPVPRTFKAVHGDDGVKIDDVTDALAAFGKPGYAALPFDRCDYQRQYGLAGVPAVQETGCLACHNGATARFRKWHGRSVRHQE